MRRPLHVPIDGSHQRTRVPGGRLGLLVLVICVAASAGAADAASDLTWRTAPDAVVVQYRIDVLRGPDPGSSVTVYGDGRVHVHRPAYYRDGGERELRLDPDELRTLVDELVGLGIADLDVQSLRQQVQRHRRLRFANKGAASQRVGAATSIVELRLESWRPAPLAKARAVDRRIVWRGLASDAAAHPDLRRLVGLAAAEARLRAFFDDPRARALDTEGIR